MTTATRCVACLPDGDDYWGVCPECKSHAGYINIGKGHWFYCAEHRVKWFIGANLFSSWRDQSEAEQRVEYDRLGFGGFPRIEPFNHPYDESAPHTCDKGDDPR